jgi:hypothetical protein
LSPPLPDALPGSRSDVAKVNVGYARLNFRLFQQYRRIRDIGHPQNMFAFGSDQRFREI